MKIKFTFLFALVGVISLRVISQTYTPVPLQNCSWYYSVLNSTSNSSSAQICWYRDNYKLFPGNDTIIFGKRYIKMFEEWVSGNSSTVTGPTCTPYSPPTSTLNLVYGIRQDTASKKIYMLNFGSSNAEILMYNFNLLKKDTVKTSIADFGSAPPCGTTRYRIIDSVYYLSYSDGICRKTFKLKPFATCSGVTAVDYFIEGYGTEAAIHTKIKFINQNFGGSGSSQSVSISTLVINTNTVSVVTNTCSQTLNIKVYNKSDVKIHPNPANEKIIIEGLDKINSIELVSLLGQPQNIQWHHHPSADVVNIENVSPGIYIIRISSEYTTVSKKIAVVE